MLFSINTTVFANDTTNHTEVAAKVATITNVAEDASNLNDDRTAGSNVTIGDAVISVSTTESELQVSTVINNESITINGIPTAHSENAKALYFTPTSSNPKYKVVNMAYVDGTETNMYFKNYNSTIDANSILKVYIRDVSSITRDYILIE